MAGFDYSWGLAGSMDDGGREEDVVYGCNTLYVWVLNTEIKYVCIMELDE